jgi:hypothetical protein
MEEIKFFNIDNDEPVREHFPELHQLFLIMVQDML